MIGTKGALIIAAVYVIFAAMLGLLAGAVTRLVLRRRLGGIALAADATFAAIVFFALGYVEARIWAVHGEWRSVGWMEYWVAIGAVVLRNVLLRPRRRIAQPANLKAKL